MSNPFPTKKTFNSRCNYAMKRIRNLGHTPNDIETRKNVFYNRTFDNCFESGDSDAIVYAIMETIYLKKDHNLLKGVRAMGETLLEDWKLHFKEANNQQLSLW